MIENLGQLRIGKRIVVPAEVVALVSFSLQRHGDHPPECVEAHFGMVHVDVLEFCRREHAVVEPRYAGGVAQRID